MNDDDVQLGNPLADELLLIARGISKVTAELHRLQVRLARMAFDVARRASADEVQS